VQATYNPRHHENFLASPALAIDPDGALRLNRDANDAQLLS
jgi:hypothetical protein